jgi:hypothetical protein
MKRNMKRGVYEAIENGEFEKVKQAFTLTPPIFNGVNDTMVEIACTHGHLEMAQWLFSQISPASIGKYLPKIFYTTGIRGHQAMVQWLLEVEPSLVTQLDDVFSSVCSKNHEMATWIYSNYPTVNVSANNEHAFRIACWYGKLEIAQWLYSIRPTLDVSALKEEAFCSACHNGHLHVVQWLLEIKPSIHISADDNAVFYHACFTGYMDVLKWLLSTGHPMDLTPGDVKRGIELCQNSEMIQWLSTVYRDK